MAEHSKVDVIIVNFKTLDLTIQATESVLRDPIVNQVIVVDNGSGDGSGEGLQQRFKADSKVKVIISPANLGFGGGNNLGVEQSRAEYVFLLNSDAFLFEGDNLGGLVSVLEKNKEIGIVAPQILLMDQKTRQADAYGIFPTPKNLILRQTQASIEPERAEWLSGVALMMRRSIYQKVGGFSDQLFMYFEDIDLNRRVQALGLKIKMEESVRIVHLGGQSFSSSWRKKQLYFQAQDIYLKLAGFGGLSRLLVKVFRTPYILYKRLTEWR